MARSVILGAGVAGLSAANTLQKLGESDPVVAEMHPYPGGLAATMEWRGCRMDLGPHRIHTVFPEVKQLIQSLVGDDLVHCERKSQIYLRNKWLDYPPRPAELISKLGVSAGVQILFSALSGKTSNLASRLRGKRPASYGAYLEQRFGRYLRNLIFDPFASKVYREEADDLDEMVGRVRLASQGLFSLLLEVLTGRSKSAVKRFLYPKEGIGLVSARLSERIVEGGGEVRLSHEAVRVRHTGGLVRSVELENQDGERSSVEASRVIATIPLCVLIDLLEPKPPAAVKEAADNLVYADSILVYTLVDRQPLTQNSWMYFPGDEAVFTRVFEVYNFSPDLVPEGMSCLCAEIPARPNDPIQFADDDELKDRVWQGFEDTGMASGAECVDQVVVKVPRAYPIYRIGYRDELRQVLDYLSGLGNLITTGRNGLFHYNNSDHSIEMGRLAAEYSHESPKESEKWYSRRDEFDAYRIVD